MIECVRNSPARELTREARTIPNADTNWPTIVVARNPYSVQGALTKIPIQQTFHYSMYRKILSLSRWKSTYSSDISLEYVS